MEVEAYLRLGYLLRGEGQHEEAVSVLKQSLVIDREARDVYNALGLIYLDLHRYDEAIAAHQRYVQLAPAEPNAYDSLGNELPVRRTVRGGSCHVRASHCATAGSFHRQHSSWEYPRSTRPLPSALARFRRLIQIAPNDFARSRIHASIAETYLRKRDLRQAAAAARMELRFEKYNMWNSVVAALEQGDKTGANKLERRLFADWPYTHKGQRFPARLSHTGAVTWPSKMGNQQSP